MHIVSTLPYYCRYMYTILLTFIFFVFSLFLPAEISAPSQLPREKKCDRLYHKVQSDLNSRSNIFSVGDALRLGSKGRYGLCMGGT